MRPASRCSVDKRAVGVERDPGHVLAVEHARDRLPDAAEAADQDVIAQLGDLGVGNVEIVVVRLEPRGDMPGEDREQRRHHHAEPRDRDRAGRDVLRQEIVAAREPDHDEGEFAGLRQQQRDLGGDRARHEK